jgi:hypothetical protein
LSIIDGPWHRTRTTLLIVVLLVVTTALIVFVVTAHDFIFRLLTIPIS